MQLCDVGTFSKSICVGCAPKFLILNSPMLLNTLTRVASPMFKSATMSVAFVWALAWPTSLSSRKQRVDRFSSSRNHNAVPSKWRLEQSLSRSGKKQKTNATNQLWVWVKTQRRNMRTHVPRCTDMLQRAEVCVLYHHGITAHSCWQKSPACHHDDSTA